MATLAKPELEAALRRLGQIAHGEGEHVDLLLLGGSVMVLVFDERPSTRDVDALILAPSDRSKIRRWVQAVAQERDWPEDWLNEGAKGFLVAATSERLIMSEPGLTVRMPTVEQLRAMKLCAWRDDVDISDARRLLAELSGDRKAVWQRVRQYLQPGRELKAEYAFHDLWEARSG